MMTVYWAGSLCVLQIYKIKFLVHTACCTHTQIELLVLLESHEQGKDNWRKICTEGTYILRTQSCRVNPTLSDFFYQDFFLHV